MHKSLLIRCMVEQDLANWSFIDLRTALLYANQASTLFGECWSVTSCPVARPNGYWVVAPDYTIDAF